MKVGWVSLLALRGEALKWRSSWKQDNLNAAWKDFEKGFIKEFIPDLWEMIEAAEDEEQWNRGSDEVQETKTSTEPKTLEAAEIRNAPVLKVTETEKTMLENLATESEKRKATETREEPKKNEVFVVEPTLSDLKSHAKITEMSTVGESVNKQVSVEERRKVQMAWVEPPPPPEPPDAGALSGSPATVLLEPKPPDLRISVARSPLEPSEPPRTPDTGPIAVISPQPEPPPTSGQHATTIGSQEIELSWAFAFDNRRLKKKEEMTIGSLAEMRAHQTVVARFLSPAAGEQTTRGREKEARAGMDCNVDLMGQAQYKFYSGPFTHQGLPLIQNNVSNQLLPTFQIFSQSINDPAVSHSSLKEPSHPLDLIPKCEEQSQPYIASTICVLRFNWLASSHLFSTPYDESIKVWSKFHLQLMLQRPFHACPTHFYFLIQLSHTFCSMGQLNSSSTMGNLCATLNAPVFSTTKEKKSDENYWVMGLNPNKLVYVVCKKPDAFLQVVPKPILNAAMKVITMNVPPPVILNVWVSHVLVPLINIDELEVLEAIQRILGRIHPLGSRILSYIGPIFKPLEQADGLVYGPLDLVTISLKKAPCNVVKAIYDVCLNAATRIILARNGPNSVLIRVFSAIIEAVMVTCQLIVFYQLKGNLQHYIFGRIEKQQLLLSSSIYVWFLLHKHMSNFLSSSCNNPKQNSLANEKIWCLHSVVLISQWDPGESNIPVIHCWSSLTTFHGLLHFVFDRGKVLMQWTGVAAMDAIWEDELILCSQFRDFSFNFVILYMIEGSFGES